MVARKVTRDGDVYTFTTSASEGEEVYLVGDFNNWSTTATPMLSCRGGLRQARLRLAPGTYRFGYFVINSDRWSGSACGDAEVGFEETPAHGPTTLHGDSSGWLLQVPGKGAAARDARDACHVRSRAL